MPDTKISAFPAATSLSASDVIPVVQGGINKKADFTLFGYLPVTASIYVDASGSDSTGTRGRADKPFLTISAAKAVAVSGDVIIVGPGTFTENSGITLPSGVSLIGAGADVTIITSTLTGLTNCVLVPGSGSVIMGITVSDTVSGGAPALGAGASDTAFSVAFVYRCKFVGKSPTVYVNKTGTDGLRVYDSIINSTSDAVICSFGTHYFFNCDATSSGSAVVDHNFICAGGTIRIYGGLLTTSGALSGKRCLETSGGNIEAYNLRIVRDTTNPGYDALNTSGTLKLDDVVKVDNSPLSTSGLVTQLGVAGLMDAIITSGDINNPEVMFDHDGTAMLHLTS